MDSRCKKNVLYLIFLICGAAAGNFFALPIIYGFDFIFGSVAIFLILALYGVRTALICGFFASLLTIIHWGHPYAVLIFMLELSVVSWLITRFNLRMIVADLIFWFTIGIPLVYILYAYSLHFPPQSALLVALKMTLNGIFNVSAAVVIHLFVQVRRQKTGRCDYLGDNLRSILYSFFVFMLVGTLILITRAEAARAEKRRTEEAAHEMVSCYRDAAHFIEDWNLSNFYAINQTAEKIEERIALSPEEWVEERDGDFLLRPNHAMQKTVETVANSYMYFHNVYVGDSAGKAVAFYPSVNEKGEPTQGLDFSDRQYYKDVKDKRQPLLSEIFMGRGGVFEPIVSFVSPIFYMDRFVGYTIGAAKLDIIQDNLRRIKNKSGVDICVVDGKNDTIASTDACAQLRRCGSQAFAAPADSNAKGVVRHIFPEKGRSRMSSYRVSYWILEQDANVSDWKFIVTFPASMVQTRLINHITGVMLAVVCMLLAGSFVVFFLAKILSRKISILADAGRLMQSPENACETLNIEFPRSIISEIDELSLSLQTAARKQAEYIAARKEHDRELREAAVIAQSANIAKSNFLATMSHEIRTPMNGIIGTIDLLKQTNPSSEQAEYVEVIVREGDNMLNIVSDILDLAKIEDSGMELEYQACNLHEILSDAGEVGRSLAIKKDVAVNVVCSDNLPQAVMCDGIRLRQALVNLVSNAVKFTDKGFVNISADSVMADAKTAKITIVVQDSGIGISEDKLPFIFDKFYQADMTIGRQYDGTGIGLHIANGIINSMGGTIEASSREGEGSTFSVCICVETCDIKMPASDNCVAEEADIQGLNVVIVEDNPMNLKIIGGVVKKLGCNPACFSNGYDAIEHLRNNGANIVFMDCHMPIIDGFETTMAIRQFNNEIPIIAITADSLSGTKQRCLDVGMNDYLTKPVRLESIRSVIERCGTKAGSIED